MPPSTRFSDHAALGPLKRAALGLVLSAFYVLIGLAILRPSTIGPPFAPGRAATTVAYSVPLDPPPPQPSAAASNKPAGDTGASAKRAKPKAIAAPPARLPNHAMIAAPAVSTGDATKSGASGAGIGTGGGAAGLGTGSGGSGDGSAAGGSRAAKIAGDITAARDYPARTRNQRIGTSVIVVLTVGTDGRVRGCRIHKPSPDPEADAITCRLAAERFRFRPATDRAGNPIESEFGWEQRWFAP